MRSNRPVIRRRHGGASVRLGVATAVTLLAVLSAAPASAGGVSQIPDVAAAVRVGNGYLGGFSSVRDPVGKGTGVQGDSGSFQLDTATAIGVGVSEALNGELTREDGGRDWYRFDAIATESYIIEVKSMMAFMPISEDGGGGDLQYVEGYLPDPSILEVVGSDGEQVLGEHDAGGFVLGSARAFLRPDRDGSYGIAVGSGEQDRGGLGFYTISVRADDHADDYRTDPSAVIRPGESAVGRIDSDVDPDDPVLNAWDWKVSAAERGDVLRPRTGIESMDDRDVFRLVIPETGWYRLSVTGGPPGVGIWRIFKGEEGYLWGYAARSPIVFMEDHIFSGTYYVVVGTPHESSGNTGSYTVTLGEMLTIRD